MANLNRNGWQKDLVRPNTIGYTFIKDRQGVSMLGATKLYPNAKMEYSKNPSKKSNFGHYKSEPVLNLGASNGWIVRYFGRDRKSVIIMRVKTKLEAQKVMIDFTRSHPNG